MTNEIKEILDELESMFEISEIEEQVNNINKIKNYITNLQNEIFDLKDTIQNKNDCIGAYECIIEDRDKRIDKVVEYIDNCFVGEEIPRGDDYVFNEYYYYEPLKKEEAIELLDILRGDE